jgi:hypothetical protein
MAAFWWPSEGINGMLAGTPEAVYAMEQALLTDAAPEPALSATWCSSAASARLCPSGA